MPTTTEPLDKGLVTSKDPSLLAPGELQQTDDLFYKPGSPSLNKTPGRNQFDGATQPADVEGLAYCGFDGANDKLIALRGPVSGTRVLLTANAGESGNFSTLLTPASGTSLEAIHYNNRHVLLTGGSNQVLLSNGTIRGNGMRPVTASPGLTHSTGSGTWPLIGQFGYYEYWTTEVYKVGTEEIEGTFVGTPSQVNVTVSTSTVTIQRPATVDVKATHWRVYRSINKGTNAASVAFPNGFRIGEVPIGTSSFVDGGGTTTGPNLAGSGDNSVTSLGISGFQATTYTGNWTSPGNLTSDDAANATSGTVSLDKSSLGGSDITATDVTSPVRAGTFGLTGIGNPITDITVILEAKKTGHAGLRVSLSWDGGVTWTADKAVALTTAMVVYTIAGGNWGRNWSSAETADGIFYVRLTAFCDGGDNDSGTVDVDYVKAQVTHGGTTGDLSTPFRDIQISLGGVATRIGAAGPPPVSTTGDIFQDSLVVNDVSNPTQVAYSMPGDIDAFPAVYLLKTDTKDKDSVTNIKSLGSVCLVGLAAQVWRVNYLPREEDAEFDRGRCIEVVDTDHGMAGTHAACKFTLNGQTMVGYISSSGPRMTNGFQALTMTDDLNWEAMVNVSALSRCILVNDARYHHLRMYYAPSGSNNLSRCLFFSYHPTHLKDGKLKVSGPQHVNVLAATSGVSGSSEKVLYTSDDTGKVFIENRGSQDDSGVGIAPILKTREMYLAGPGNEWQLQQVFIHHQSEGGGTYNVSYEVAKTNTNVRATGPKPFTMIRRGLSNISSNESGEGISIKITGTDDNLPASLDYLVLEGTNMGVSDPLTR